MQLDKVIINKIQEMDKDGSLSKMIEKHLETAIDEALKETLKSWGPIRKQIDKILEDNIGVNLSQLDFEKYNVSIANFTKNYIDSVIDSQLQGNYKQMLDELFVKYKDKEIKVSKILSMFQERERLDESESDSYDYEDRGNYCSIHIEDERKDSVLIYMDPEDGLEPYECSYRIHIYNNKIIGLKIDDKEITKSLMIGKLYDFDRFLFWAYSNSIEIINDSPDPEDYYYKGNSY